MVDRVGKFIQRLRIKERQAVLGTLRRIRSGDFAGMDMRKLSGTEDCWRVRVGSFRIIFRRGLPVDVISVDRRNDNTYKL